MTGDRRRWDSVKDDYTQILASLENPKTLDAGCGTGGEALLLAALGCEVTGVDASPEFIEYAKQKSEMSGIKAAFQVGDIRNLLSIPDSSFGLLISRGNTLPHLHTAEDLNVFFASLAKVAEPGAMLILSWLNYTPVLRDRNRIIGATEGGERIFVRFYDFRDDEMLTFNVLTLSKREKGTHLNNRLVSTLLKPWSVDDVGMLLRRNGWGELEIAADLRRTEFDPDSSKDAVFYAIRD